MVAATTPNGARPYRLAIWGPGVEVVGAKVRSAAKHGCVTRT